MQQSGTFEYQSGSTGMRDLSKDDRFTRVIAAIWGDKQVYAASIWGKVTYGTSLSEYFKTITSESVNFQGTLTLEQAQELGISYNTETPPKITVLNALIQYAIKHPTKFEKADLESLVNTLIQKGVKFSAEDVKHAQKSGIDLGEIWAQAHATRWMGANSLDFNKSSLFDVTKAMPTPPTAVSNENIAASPSTDPQKMGVDTGFPALLLSQQEALLRQYFLQAPLASIFPAVLNQELNDKFPRIQKICFEALTSREQEILKARDTAKQEKEDLFKLLSTHSLEQSIQVTQTKTSLEHASTLEQSASQIAFLLNELKIHTKGHQLIEESGQIYDKFEEITQNQSAIKEMKESIVKTDTELRKLQTEQQEIEKKVLLATTQKNTTSVQTLSISHQSLSSQITVKNKELAILQDKQNQYAAKDKDLHAEVYNTISPHLYATAQEYNNLVVQRGKLTPFNLEAEKETHKTFTVSGGLYSHITQHHLTNEQRVTRLSQNLKDLQNSGSQNGFALQNALGILSTGIDVRTFKNTQATTALHMVLQNDCKDPMKYKAAIALNALDPTQRTTKTTSDKKTPLQAAHSTSYNGSHVQKYFDGLNQQANTTTKQK